jgi:hypothetical protein
MLTMEQEFANDYGVEWTAKDVLGDECDVDPSRLAVAVVPDDGPPYT